MHYEPVTPKKVEKYLKSIKSFAKDLVNGSLTLNALGEY